RIDVDDVRVVNPNAIFVRASGQGTRGPEAANKAFDATSYWARSGLWHTQTRRGQKWPSPVALGGGDLNSAVALAGAIAAALFHRERTGTAAVVDVSLLASAMWTMSSDIVGASVAADVADAAGG